MPDSVALPLGLRVAEGLCVCEALEVCVPLLVDVRDCDWDGDPVGDGVGLPLALCVRVSELLAE